MRRTVEVGTSIKEATDKALRALEIQDDERYEVTILEEPARGFLGITSRPARVEVRVLENDQPPEPVAALPAATRTAPAPAGAAPPSRPRAPEHPSPRRPRTAFAPMPPGPHPRPAGAASPASLADGSPEASDASPPDVAFLRGFLGELVARMGYTDLQVRDEGLVDSGACLLSIEGEGATDLIGGRGARLKALEYLVNLVSILRQPPAGRTVLDVGGYREARLQRLHALAEHMADRAQRTGRPARLQPMDSADRKVIHEYLAGHRGVTTSSEGREPHRCLVITPTSPRHPRHPAPRPRRPLPPGPGPRLGPAPARPAPGRVSPGPAPRHPSGGFPDRRAGPTRRMPYRD